MMREKRKKKESKASRRIEYFYIVVIASGGAESDYIRKFGNTPLFNAERSMPAALCTGQCQ